ncbi:MAG: two-component system, OmpR family, phosphate regulon sensor histidine kinase PhoR [Thermoanaerobaculia bacterium]|jgi:two-component system phosphate regulon sensor histidine kinase PhoR|nr:two-component system, OmpR family, phosphate regulon sensor histidine kinase PhoR [Thermoanaerobaculia bacterium]
MLPVALIFAFAALASAIVFATIWSRMRADIRRLTDRLGRDDAEASASLDVDSFGALDEIASRFYRSRSELARRLAASEFQNALLQQIMNGMGEGVLAIDRQRRVVLANRRFASMFNLDAGFLGQPISSVLRSEAVLSGFDRVLDRAASNAESASRFSLRSGIEERTIEMRAFALPSHELAAVALFIDVSQVERLEELRREFIADFSHEVRTPLAALKSAVETFEHDRVHLSDEQDGQLRRIMTRQLSRLERLAQDLSELSHIEAGDLSLERAEIDLRRLLEDLREDFRDRAAQKKLHFVITGEGAHVHGDAMRIQQAFSNLLDNAIKYGGEGTSIDLEVTSRAGSGVVRITDHGEGIPAEERDRIFRRFYRIDKSRSQQIAGTGLGLAITKHLILQHRGNIEVESEPGRGATFVVTLPE